MPCRPGSGAPMAATTHPSPEGAEGHRPAAAPAKGAEPGAGRPALRTLRFDLTERVVHWTSAVVVLSLTATGAFLYVPSLGTLVGHRLAVEDAHVWAGVAVFAPVLGGVLGPWGRRLRHDLHQVRDLGPAELDWLRSLGRLGRSALGKFNPGQKLSTNAMAGLLVVLFATGLVMRWGNFMPVGMRTGATFVHDVSAFALLAVVLGHIGFALSHPNALRSMVTGWVPARWVQRHAPAWQGEELPPRSARGEPR